MKVYVGPFVKYLSVMKFEDRYLEWRFNKEAYEVKTRDHKWYDRVVIGTLHCIQLAIRPINRFNEWRSRKIKIRIDKYDIWNADSTLALVILPTLRKIREDRFGTPEVEDCDVPFELHYRSTRSAEEIALGKTLNEITDDLREKRWNHVLDSMIWAFEQHEMDARGKSWEDQYMSGESDINFVGVDANGNAVDDDDDAEMYEMVRGIEDTFVYDAEGAKAHIQKMQAGTILFGKYYANLWT